MELSRRKVPLYGQAKVFALLEGLDAVPGDVEVFIVLEGSTLLHFIKALSDVMLCFIVPGHNLAEVVSVQAYLCSETLPLTWVGGATLEYIQDDAQDLAEHLVTHGHRLSSLDHRELSSIFSLGQRSCRWAMDQRVALAMANLDIPQSWNVLGGPCGEDRSPRESPLHLAVRWGLGRLAEFLLCQPGGLMAVRLPNEDGVTPLQLAQAAGNAELQDLLKNPPNPLSTPPAGLSQVWADRRRLLRFCHDTGNLSLTVRQNERRDPRRGLHSDILLLRERLRDADFLREIKALRRISTGSVLEKDEAKGGPTENAMYPYISENSSASAENDCEEPLMFCLNGEDEEGSPSPSHSEQRAFSLTETTRDKRILGFRKRAQSAEEESSASIQHLTLTEFLKEIEDEEEWDKYIIPSKVESEKYKVSRTFSFLKSRMQSTRSKTKVKEGKEKPGGGANGHQFVAAGGGGGGGGGAPPGPSVCVACERPVPGKDLLQCSNCSLSVHKSCRESASACGKKPQEKNALAMKSKASTLPQDSAKDTSSPFSSSPSSSSSFVTTATREKRETAPLSKSLSISISTDCSDVTAVDGEGGAASPARGFLSEETMPTTSTPTSAEPPPTTTSTSTSTEEPVDSPLLSALSPDLMGLAVESWSLVVSADFCRLHDKRTVKRQDVIYELMQTELHHIQTLTVMSEVFRRGMVDELQLDWDCVARVFPCLDPLLLFHRNLFSALQDRRQASAPAHHPRNYLIQNIGDILLQQFSGENAEKMKRLYGDFCSHHTEAVNLFKELQQQNKKLQLFVKQQSNKSLVKRREVPEFILLVTQRITKYPVLLERILQYTQEGSQDYSDLSRALTQIRDIITAVDLSVSRYEKRQELHEVMGRLENKSLAKLKNDKVFRKQDLRSPHRDLLHKGLVYWKTATGRLKDTLALLLTDVLVFLQEKDQRFVFAAVDQKPPVIPLQKLIVREVANEERGMFLISASSVGPEMYEVHTATREERNAWMRHIRRAVESCPEEEEEEERSTESEEARRASDARVQKIQKFQETLLGQDQQICSSLEEKLQLYAELTELTLGPGEPAPQRHLLASPDTDAETPRQASTLLTAAVNEAEKLLNILQAGEAFSSQGPETCSYNSHGSVPESPSEPDYLSTLSVSSTSLVSDGEWAGPDGLLCSSPTETRGDVTGTQATVADSVQSLTQLLYSLQAVVTLQDSYYEVQKLLLMEGPRPQPRNALQNNQDQEKQRSLERKREDAEKKDSNRRREEVDGVHKLHARLKQEQQLWDRECLAREKQQTQQELLLEQRERQCLLEAERLLCERKELDAQLLEYQQNVDRLWEGQRSVEREKERVDAQQRLLQSWKHNRQSSLPVMIPLDGYQVEEKRHHHPLLQHHHHHHHHPLLQQHHHHNNNHHQSCHAGPGKLQSSTPPSPAHSPAHSPSLYNSLNTLLSQAHVKPPPPLPPPPPPNKLALGRRAQLHQHNNGSRKRKPSEFYIWHTVVCCFKSDLSPPSERVSLGAWRPGVTGLGLYEDDYPSSASLTPLLSPQAYLALDGQNGEEGEENIVYL
ncbi:unnamed protein product [Merluccius merluccius]